MAPVFGHGRLRLYLLKLLAEAPRHGYEVIRLLEERFQGLYAPSAGTVYPRLAKLEVEGLVSHTVEGGRKVYALTPDGRGELASRQDELSALEREIHDSLSALAADIREDVSGSAHELREEMLHAAEEARRGAGRRWSDKGPEGAGEAGAREAAGWREEARRAREESRRARREAKQAKEAAREHFEQAARRVQERLSSHASAGDWPGAVREGLEGLSREVGGWSRRMEHWFAAAEAGHSEEGARHGEHEEAPVADPERELGRLLDRFRDDVRDAARDHGVSQEQLREARRQLSTVSAHLGVLLRHPDCHHDGPV